MANKNYLQGVTLSLIASVSLGIVGIVDKVGILQSSNPFNFSYQSLFFSLIFTIIFTLIYFKRLPVNEVKNLSVSSWGLIFLIGIFASGIFILLRFIGLTQSTGTFATLSQIITSALTAIFAWIMLRERLSGSFWVLFVVIILSMYFVSVGSLTLGNIKPGDSYILFGTLFLALANIFSRLAVQKVDPVLLTLGRFIVGFVFLLIFSPLLINNHGIFDSFTIWAAISGLLWTTMIIVFNFALKKIGVTLTTSLLMVSPVITMALEYSLLGYHFTLVQVIAALAVVTGGIAVIFASGGPKLK